MSDRVAAAAAELYGAEPAEFARRRKALADEARGAGDRDAAKRIMALRKPTRAAWVVNQLSRADPDIPGRLKALAAELRAAAEAADGRKLRALSARRGELIGDLTGRALEAADVADPPPTLRSEVEDTLTSALADPKTADRFAAGTLTRAAEWAGFGAFTPPDRPATGGKAADADEGSPEATRAKPASHAKPRAAPTSRRSHTPAPRRAGKESGRAEASDELAARRRKALDDAERMVASAAEAATAAVSREEELEAEVRQLEERLTEARAELATARTRARRAESAERKARQRRDQLPPP